jgi:ribose transport system ATP-binding protein
MNSAADLLEIRGIARKFRAVTALPSTTFSARAGEIHALMAANGACKSTLAKILSGISDAADEATLHGLGPSLGLDA